MWRSRDGTRTMSGQRPPLSLPRTTSVPEIIVSCGGNSGPQHLFGIELHFTVTCILPGAASRPTRYNHARYRRLPERVQLEETTFPSSRSTPAAEKPATIERLRALSFFSPRESRSTGDNIEEDV